MSLCPGVTRHLVRKIFDIAKPFFPLFSILCLIKHFLWQVKATATEVFSSVVLTSEGRTSPPFVFSLRPDFTPFLFCTMMAQPISLRLLSHLPLELIQKGASAGREVQMGQISYFFLLFGTSCISTCPYPPIHPYPTSNSGFYLQPLAL